MIDLKKKKEEKSSLKEVGWCRCPDACNTNMYGGQGRAVDKGKEGANERRSGKVVQAFWMGFKKNFDIGERDNWRIGQRDTGKRRRKLEKRESGRKRLRGKRE